MGLEAPVANTSLDGIEVATLDGRVCSLCGARALLVACAEGHSVIGACDGAHLVELREILARGLRFAFAHLSIPAAA